MITRIKESDIRRSLNSFPAVGILGPRQCGKTTLVKSFANGLLRPTIYLDMESRRDRNALSDPELFFSNHLNDCLIIDEIQLVPELFPPLRSSIDGHKVPSRFIILGSSSPKLLRHSNESLAGRISYHELTPFLFTEINESITHRLRGGYPDCYLSSTDAMAFEWLENYIQSYTERELPALGLNTSATNIYRLMRMLSHLHGQLLNIDQLSRSLGLSAKSIKNYIDFLSEAFIIRILPPYYHNTKKRLIKAPKVYIRDVGIFHALAGISSMNELEFHPKIGESWEGYVIEQVISSLPKSIEAMYYRTQHGNEIDLILMKGQTVLCAIEIKNTLSPKPSRGFRLSIEELVPKMKLFIVPASESYQLERDVFVVGLQEAIRRVQQELK